MPRQLRFDFASERPHVTARRADRPKGYTGFYGLHKYWGKKPHEPLAFLIEQLTRKDDAVLDTFVGSGTAAREALLAGRRFVGCDINPVAIELTRLMVSPPDYGVVRDALRTIERAVKSRVCETYTLRDGRVASHYLWDNDAMRQVWVREDGRARREELSPSAHDLRLSAGLASYRSRLVREPVFFSNSRINARTDLSLPDLLTGRAQHNIDLLLEAISQLPEHARMPMKLCLTAASGQMSKMVFAVTGRGKTTGKSSASIEVGSWVIGYWRPRLHFEVNVWNCFERRVSKLLKALKAGDALQGAPLAGSLDAYYESDMHCCVECSPCQSFVGRVRDESIGLVLTDPPHSDRIPYLELSELWNSILDTEPCFDSEIVVSNAKERRKTPDTYTSDMHDLLAILPRVMRKDGFVVLLYNARQEERWDFIAQVASESAELDYLGHFPCNYSANSVVQDNRAGSMKSDFALIFGTRHADDARLKLLRDIPDWSDSTPAL